MGVPISPSSFPPMTLLASSLRWFYPPSPCRRLSTSSRTNLPPRWEEPVQGAPFTFLLRSRAPPQLLTILPSLPIRLSAAVIPPVPLFFVQVSIDHSPLVSGWISLRVQRPFPSSWVLLSLDSALRRSDDRCTTPSLGFWWCVVLKPNAQQLTKFIYQ